MNILSTKNYISLFLLSFFISFIFLGTQYFKYIYLINFLSLFFFTKIKIINFKIFVINFIGILYIIIFSENIDFSKLIIISLLIIFSFEFYEFQQIKGQYLIGVILIIFLSLLFLLYPPIDDYYLVLDISKSTKYIKLLEGKYNYMASIFVNSEFQPSVKIPDATYFTTKYILSDIPSYTDYCYSSSGIFLNECKYKSIWLYNRLSYNSLDPNLTAIILITITNFLSNNFIFKKNSLKKIVFLILFAIILATTKSRALYIYLFFYFFTLYFFNFINRFSVVSIFLIFNFIIYLFAFTLVFVDLLSIDYNIPKNLTAMYRLIDISDSSLRLRFDQIVDSIVLQSSNLKIILLPDNYLHVKNIFFNGREISSETYSPHNSLLALIKDFGLIITILFFYNLRIFIKKSNRQFNFYLVPLLLTTAFLGYTGFLLVIFLVFISLKIKSEQTNLI